MREAESRRRATPPDPRRPWMRKGESDDIADRAINLILNSEYQRWVNFSRTRLRQFGYEFDSF